MRALGWGVIAVTAIVLSGCAGSGESGSDRRRQFTGTTAEILRWAACKRGIDLGFGIWRNCFEGHETWRNTVERGQRYAAGDAWGCVGRWFSGRWHTDASTRYVGRVKDYLDQRIWETPNFQQP